jgi:hypothetical protein
MSLTVFLAISILACDVLIYFLYEWAFGESKRIRKRRARSRFEAPAGETSRGSAVRSDSGDGRIISLDRQRAKPAARPRALGYQERLAYRRLADSYVQVKRRA